MAETIGSRGTSFALLTQMSTAPSLVSPIPLCGVAETIDPLSTLAWIIQGPQMNGLSAKILNFGLPLAPPYDESNA